MIFLGLADWQAHQLAAKQAEHQLQRQVKHFIPCKKVLCKKCTQIWFCKFT